MRREEEKAALVEQERRRLLQEFAHLKDFFPKGVLKQMEDMAIVDNALQQRA